MNKIIVYEEENFEGFMKEFTCSVPDLHAVDFGDCISSLKVIGQPWLVFRDPNYKGVGFAYEEGEHKHVQLSNNISSIELVTEDLEDPQITLYEHPNCEGISKVIKEETNLSFGYFNDKASSHIVQKGAWLLYEHPKRGGWYYIAREGAKLDNYGPVYHFHDKCSHVYPLKSGRPVITSRILWDRKILESERDVMIDEINCLNNTAAEQTFTTTTSRTYEIFTSHSFKIAVPNRPINESFKLSIDPSTNLTVEKGNIDSVTTVNKVEVTMPAKVPPKSELNIQVMMKVVTASVPVELIITINGKSRTEIGQYRSVSGRNIITKYSMKSVKN